MFGRQGECLWRLAHTAIATAWPDMIGHQREHDVCSGVELVLAALLSQAYSAFSKVRMNFTGAQRVVRLIERTEPGA